MAVYDIQSDSSEDLPNEFYNNLMDKYNITKDWILVSTPYPTIAILLVYLFFVLKLGPDFMKHRRPYELKTVMRIYNIIQVLYNGYLIHAVFEHPSGIPSVIANTCVLKDDEKYDELKHAFLFYTWHFLVLKIVDLMDTVFMVFRKKDSHITFLHLYHHVAMVFFTWFTFSYIKPHHGVIPAAINVLVHTIMYSYYFLATFAQLKRYLWWKKHLTKIQLGQFVIILLYISVLYYNGCPISKAFSYIWMFNVFVIFLLFVNFYIKAYIVKSSKSRRQKLYDKLS
uniref:Elongation of very long chain fatty acids protein n=1 Tax=Graphocephala atropunctata TaxID=36148 RepID=A0A1B6KUK3_9HEMI